MKVIIDNNIFLDSFLPNREHKPVSDIVLAECKGYGLVSVSSLTDIYYFLNKELGSERAKIIIRKIITNYDIIDSTKADALAALDLPTNDFEDALVAVCAIKASADIIVSRDKKFRKMNCGISVITPEDFLRSILADKRTPLNPKR
ncbi:MAG: PIN domain-containing protein [Oscillospiraceae bacterium]|jgi:predicted nucleic acid-binding protein|nr:PIN domain-containing protein [Oscillospiraceae bacterium]